MLQVLVAGLIALGSKWLLDGGIRRRDRHMIREELELADLLGDRPEAQQLRESAERRLQRYLRPPLTKRAAPVVRSLSPTLISVILAVVGIRATQGSIGNGWEQLVTGLAFGGMSAVTVQTVQLALQTRTYRREDRAYTAEVEALMRERERRARGLDS